MSAILLTNPFAAPPASQSGQTTSSETSLPAIPSASDPQDAKDTLQSKGAETGADTSKQAETAALLRQFQQSARPSDATSDSVISAQATGTDGEEEPRIGPDLPEVEMPDPLPTSPILLRMRDEA